MHAYESTSRPLPDLSERWALLLAHRDYAVRVVGPVAVGVDTEDCVHEAILRLVKRPELDPDRVRALLVRTALYIGIDHARRRQRKEKTVRLLSPLSAQIVDAESIVSRRDDAEQVIAAIEMLPRAAREVLTLRLLGELTARETAARLGVSVKAVEGSYTRGLRALRALLDGAPPLGDATRRAVRRRRDQELPRPLR